MKSAQTKIVEPAARQTFTTSAQARITMLVIMFLVGLGVGALLIYRATKRPTAGVGETGGALSESTRAILKNLSSPVELRFHSLLDPASTSDALRDFAGRVDQLVSEYEREGGAKIKLTKNTARSDSAANAASADGIKAFNLEKGDACFLGVAVACNGQKETLAQLSPEWEAALESDLSRAIARVSTAKPAGKSAAIETAAPVNAKIVEEVKRAVPNLESMSLADATQALRVEALKEFVDATEAMEKAVKAAEDRIKQAETSGSEADKQAAVKQLQQVQSEHNEKLKQVAAHLQNQISALESLKKK